MTATNVPAKPARPPAKLRTADDLLNLGDAGKGYELIDGRLVEKAMGAGSSGVNRRVLQRVANFADENGLGETFDSECGYQCFPHDLQRVRKPDVSFVRRDRLPDGRTPQGWFPIRPDLAVEVLSPKDRVQRLNGKLADYRAAGVPLVWVLDPVGRTVVIHTAAEPYHDFLEADDMLSGGDVLPRFSVKVSDLFPPPPENRA